MSSSYSPDLRIELIGTGDQAGIWGSTTNTNLEYVIEPAIAGYISVAVASANQALTYVDGGSAVPGDNQAVHAVLALTTSTGANFAVYVPPASKLYTIYNASSYTATIYCSTVIGNTTAAGTGVAIPAGKTMSVWSDGTNVAQQNTAFIAPALGTPASGVMTNVTGLPLSTGITGFGTGVATALATNVGSAGAPVVNGGVLGTPSSGTLTNATGLPLTTGVTGTLPVANGGTGVTSSTGTGNVVLSNSPTLVTPILGTPQSGNFSSGTFTWPTFNQSTSGNAATATSPAGGGSFITSLNIGSQTVATAGTCSGNAATATSPQSGGSFITTSNIGSQSVSYATTAGNGGVTSVNGSTGAVSVYSTRVFAGNGISVNTNSGDVTVTQVAVSDLSVGCVCILAYSSTSVVQPGSTVSGSYLFRTTAGPGGSQPDNTLYANGNLINRTTAFTDQEGRTYSPVSGTWRVIGSNGTYSAAYVPGDNYTAMYTNLFIRVS